MIGLGEFNETIEAKDVAKEQPLEISTDTYKKFDEIMQDEAWKNEHQDRIDEKAKLDYDESLSKFLSVFTGESVSSQMEQSDACVYGQSLSEDGNPNLEMREYHSDYDFGGNTFETDDDGKIYKKDGVLPPNMEYTVNGNRYRTDENGRPISCDANPVYTDDGARNTREQKESGGEERHDDDDGGHIIAKILGGAEGIENLVPMRRTINRGDYKKMENEISRALQEGKQVTVHIDLTYKGDSQRPAKIRAEYTIDGKKTVVEFDNDENSTELLDTLDTIIEEDDFNLLKAEIEDMESEGISASVTSVKIEYDENGNPTYVTVGLLDESTGEKTYRSFSPRKEQ